MPLLDLKGDSVGRPNIARKFSGNEFENDANDFLFVKQKT